jgi:hypothetical protein
LNGKELEIKADEKNNSLIKIEKNDSNDSNKNKMTPEVELLSPESSDITPELEDLNPRNGSDPSTESDNSGITGDIGDKQDNMLIMLQDLVYDLIDGMTCERNTTQVYTDLGNKSHCQNNPLPSTIDLLHN